MKTKNYLLSLSLVISSIASTYFVVSYNVSNAQQTTIQRGTADNEYQVGAVLYMQHAAEYRALAYQAFNLAKMSLDADDKTKRKLPKAERKKTRAVIVDVDETVLNNSPQQVFFIKNHLSFTSSLFTEWINKRMAKPIHGAVDFLNYVNREGVKVFYVTNRGQADKQGTIDNLKAVGFPDVNEETVMVKTTESSKEARRQAISAKHRIVLLIGDNLNDFSNVFEGKSINDRFAETDKMRDLWGTRWIVLPNAMYGDWESALYEYKRLTEEEKTARRTSLLQSF